MTYEYFNHCLTGHGIQCVSEVKENHDVCALKHCLTGHGIQYVSIVTVKENHDVCVLKVLEPTNDDFFLSFDFIIMVLVCATNTSPN
jgi:hypothetical protein